MHENRKSSADKLQRIILLILIGVIAYLFNRYNLLQHTLDWIKTFGIWGPALFIAVYILTSIFFVPSFVFTFAAGALFGLPLGILYTLIGSGLGAVGAFLIGRYLARDWAHGIFEKNPKFAAMDQAIKTKGWKIVVLARLTPIFPFMVANYAFGLTRISAYAYWGASVLGTIPSTSVYVYLGSIAGSLSTNSGHGPKTPVEWGLLAAGFVATILLTWYIRKISQTALENQLQE